MTSLPNLAAYDGVLFDLDGVLTPTAAVHMNAWQRMFDDLFAQWNVTPAYTSEDYFRFVDGKKRYDGVAAVLRSRDLEVPWGDPSDDVSEDTVCGIGNRKNVFFLEVLEGGIQAYPGSLELIKALQARSVPMAVVSSSKNAQAVLAAAELTDYFVAIVDGQVAERDGLASKPAPDMFLRGAEELGLDPARVAAVEDAESGVASASAAGCSLVVGVDRGAGPEVLRSHGANVIVSDLDELVPALPAA